MCLVDMDVVVAGAFKLSGLSLILTTIAFAVVFVLVDGALPTPLSPLFRLPKILNFRVCAIADLV